MAELKQKLKRRGKEENDILVRDLTKQNLDFRKKVDDLRMRLAKYEQ